MDDALPVHKDLFLGHVTFLWVRDDISMVKNQFRGWGLGLGFRRNLGVATKFLLCLMS